MRFLCLGCNRRLYKYELKIMKGFCLVCYAHRTMRRGGDLMTYKEINRLHLIHVLSEIRFLMDSDEPRILIKAKQKLRTLTNNLIEQKGSCFMFKVVPPQELEQNETRYKKF